MNSITVNKIQLKKRNLLNSIVPKQQTETFTVNINVGTQFHMRSPSVLSRELIENPKDNTDSCDFSTLSHNQKQQPERTSPQKFIQKQSKSMNRSQLSSIKKNQDTLELAQIAQSRKVTFAKKTKYKQIEFAGQKSCHIAINALPKRKGTLSMPRRTAIIAKFNAGKKQNSLSRSPDQSLKLNTGSPKDLSQNIIQGSDTFANMYAIQELRSRLAVFGRSKNLKPYLKQKRNIFVTQDIKVNTTDSQKTFDKIAVVCLDNNRATDGLICQLHLKTASSRKNSDFLTTEIFHTRNERSQLKQTNDDTRKLKLLAPETLKNLKDELNKINQTPDVPNNNKLGRRASEPSFESAFSLFMKQTTIVDEKDASVRVIDDEKLLITNEMQEPEVVMNGNTYHQISPQLNSNIEAKFMHDPTFFNAIKHQQNHLLSRDQRHAHIILIQELAEQDQDPKTANYESIKVVYSPRKSSQIRKYFTKGTFRQTKQKESIVVHQEQVKKLEQKQFGSEILLQKINSDQISDSQISGLKFKQQQRSSSRDTLSYRRTLLKTKLKTALEEQNLLDSTQLLKLRTPMLTSRQNVKPQLEIIDDIKKNSIDAIQNQQQLHFSREDYSKPLFKITQGIQSQAFNFDIIQQTTLPFKEQESQQNAVEQYRKTCEIESDVNENPLSVNSDTISSAWDLNSNLNSQYANLNSLQFISSRASQKHGSFNLNQKQQTEILKRPLRSRASYNSEGRTQKLPYSNDQNENLDKKDQNNNQIHKQIQSVKQLRLPRFSSISRDKTGPSLRLQQSAEGVQFLQVPEKQSTLMSHVKGMLLESRQVQSIKWALSQLAESNVDKKPELGINEMANLGNKEKTVQRFLQFKHRQSKKVRLETQRFLRDGGDHLANWVASHETSAQQQPQQTTPRGKIVLKL